MMTVRFLLPLAALSMMAGCASQPDAPAASSETAAARPATTADKALIEQGLAPAVNVIPDSGIGPQTLESGDCALFLWSKTDPSQFIFFQRAASGAARMRLADETVDAIQTTNSGEVFGQFMTQQAFLAPGGEVVEIIFQPGEALQGGQRVDNGRLTITADDRWRTVIPVLGVRACTP